MGQKTFKDISNNSMTMASQLSLKKMIPQLLLSVSIFSFVFSYSSFTSSSYSSTYHHPHQSLGFYYYYYIANKFQILLSSYGFNKNCLFLICNGLLVLLAKTSGFNIDYHAGFDLDDMLQKKICGDDVSMEQLMSEAKNYEKTLVDQTYISSIEEEAEETEQEKIITEHGQWSKDDDEGPKEVSIFIADDAERDRKTEENDQKISSLWLFDGDEDELVYEEEEADRDEQREDKRELSTEELNQKFEEFIRKMKEEIIVSEAQQNNNG